MSSIVSIIMLNYMLMESKRPDQAFGQQEGETVIDFDMPVVCKRCGFITYKPAKWRKSRYDNHVEQIGNVPTSHVETCDRCPPPS